MTNSPNSFGPDRWPRAEQDGATGSVTGWVGKTKGGDPEAVGPLWDRYFDRLVGLARARSTRVGGVDRDEAEDVALSAFHSLWRGAADGRFERMRDRDDLWRLLVRITYNKLVDRGRHARCTKRGSGRVVLESDLGGASTDDTDVVGVSLDDLSDDGPTPEFATLLDEQYALRLETLGDPGLRRIALLRLEGYGHGEIAARLGCSVRTVQRKLDLIRMIWSRS